MNYFVIFFKKKFFFWGGGVGGKNSGVQLKNENKGDEMVEILDILH